MKEDKQLLVITHLSQLLDFISGIGGFIGSIRSVYGRGIMACIG